MKLHTGRRLAAAALVSTVGLAGLMAPSPAHAAITNGWVNAYGGLGDDAEVCDTSPYADVPDSVAITDNSVPVSQSYSVSATITNPDNAADVTDARLSSSATAKVTPITGGAARIDVSATAQTHAVARLGASATECDGYANASGGTAFEFKLTAPMWVTVNAATAGSLRSSGYIDVEGDNGGGLEVWASSKASGSGTALLPAGDYSFYARAFASSHATSTSGAQDSVVSGSFSAVLSPVGAASAQTGKGGRFVTFGERNCANNSVPASFGKALKKKAKAVKVTVNGAKRLNITKAKKLKRTRSVVLGGIAPTAPATVAATVTLKNGKKVTVSRSYLACS